ncbi:MAG: RnfABCDGE type electron transport complex subunit D [Christensenellales bacterium]|jgi:electron transport complex protein RnfD
MPLRLSTAPHIRGRASTASLMGNVLIALLPCAAAGAYFFGLNTLWILLISTVSAVAAELIWQLLARQTIRIGDLSAAVTGLLLGLNLPPTAPWWLAVIGSFIAVILVKQLFGGIGDNFMNPALAARGILLASWPVRMTAFVLPGADAVSSATPLAGADFTMLQKFLGEIPGCIGEVSKVAILVGFCYLLLTRTISWRIPVTLILTTFVLSLFTSGGIMGATDAILSGGLLFGAVFMATDYVTCPMTARGQFLYAAFVGLVIWVVRSFCNYPEGVTYGILLGNIVTPLIDRFMPERIYGYGKEAKSNG